MIKKIKLKAIFHPNNYVSFIAFLRPDAHIENLDK